MSEPHVLDGRDPVATQALKENERLRGEVHFLQEQCTLLNRRALAAETLVSELRAENAKQAEDIRLLAEEVRRLREEVGSHKTPGARKDSTNSSMPPSSDPPLTRAQRRARARAEVKRRMAAAQVAGKPPKKRGAQIGHKGHHRARVEPTGAIEHHPSTCGCGEDLSSLPGRHCATRQVIDVPPVEVSAIDHLLFKVRCPNCQRLNKAEWPTEAKAAVSYGGGLRSLAVWLLDRHGVPVDRVAEILHELTGTEISAGSVLSWQAKLANSLGDFDDHARRALIAARVLHADETGIGIDLEDEWIHVALSDDVVRFHLGNRGHEGVEAGHVLQYTAAAVCVDQYPTYNKYYPGWAAQLPCWAHWLRKLDNVAKLDGCDFASKLAELIRTTLHKTHNLQLSRTGRYSLTDRDLATLENQIQRLCDTGLKSCQPRSHDTPEQEELRHKGLNLLNTIKAHPNTLAFARDFTLPATNNSAEQALRYPKVILRGKTGWRSRSATQHKLLVASYLETAARAGMDRLAAIREAMLGKPYLPALS